MSNNTRSNDNIQFDMALSLHIRFIKDTWNILEKFDIFVPYPKDLITFSAA